MEAEYVRERRRRRTVVILGIVLAILAATATYYLVTRQGGGPATATQKTIVVAAVDIPQGDVIEPGDLRETPVTDSAALATAATNSSQVVGRVAFIRIPAGSPLLAGMFGQGSATGLAILPEGEELTPDSPPWRAVSVRIPADRAVAGRVEPGDHVDLFATIEIQIFDETGASTDTALLPQGYYTGFTTKVTWSNLEVLAFEPNDELYVLRVDQHQAEEIAHVQGSGADNSFTMSLRAQADARELDRSGYGETTNRILEQYNYPIPQIINLDTYPQPSPQPSPFTPGGAPPPASTPAPAPGTAAPASPEASPAT
jgi:Flp pilus assembly protein CpaB